MSKIKFVNSHTVQVPLYKVTNEGIEVVGERLIHLVKGSKETEEGRQTGFIADDLLILCKEYLTAANKVVPSKETEAAIVHISTAIGLLEQRQLDRKKRGVAQTYKK